MARENSRCPQCIGGLRNALAAPQFWMCSSTYVSGPVHTYIVSGSIHICMSLARTCVSGPVPDTQPGPLGGWALGTSR